MEWVDFIAVLAVIQYLYFGFQVARARDRYGIKAPAISGNDEFERIYRVQANTMEMLVAFLPALYIAADEWSTTLVGLIGLVYLAGRFIYARSYVSNPSSRATGFLLSAVPIMVLLLMALLGVIF